MATKQNLILRSKDRFSGTSSNFKLKTNRGISGMYSVHSVLFPNTIYNVTDSNNTIDYNSGTLLTLSPGYYDSSNIASALKTLLESPVVDTYTVSVSTTTGLLTVTSDTTTNFSLDFTDGLEQILGLSSSLSGASTYTGTNVINYDIIISCGIYIEQSTFQNLENIVDDSFNSSIYVPLSKGNFGSYMTIDSEGDFEQNLYFEHPIRTLDIKIINLSDQSELDLNGAEFEILLRKL